MTRRLPPLNSLRAFEAAARHKSISGAAVELSVTHGAVSRHVLKLEQHIGAKLFQRDHQRLSLTPRGEAYAKRLCVALDLIQDATRENFGAHADRCPLRIGIYPTFANHVLIPRLARFRERHPDITFQVETSHTAPDPGSEIDIAVRLGTGDWPDLVAEELFPEELLPVGSPTLLCGRALTSAEDFRQFTLLHAAPRPNDWQQWLKRAGVENIDAHKGMQFEHSGMVYQAAVNGLGVAMAQTAHIGEHLISGSLIPFFDLKLCTSRSYYLVYAPQKASDRKIRAFVEWMHDELDTLTRKLPAHPSFSRL
jgi:LysR family transcriptional regulator, glycine cleavage system transcriptional activator